jgi:hypothetical protein
MTSLRWIALDWVIKVRPGVNTNAFDDLTAMWLKKHGYIRRAVSSERVYWVPTAFGVIQWEHVQNTG